MAYVKREARPEIVACDVPVAVTVPAGLTFCEDAGVALAGLGPGTARFWLSKGSTSMVDAVVAALDLTGPASLWLTSWTVAPTEAARLAALLADARVVGLRLLTDDSLRRRHPSYVAAWRARFGAESIRLCKVHAKLAVLEGERATVTVASSANMNTARRLESFFAVMGAEPANTITTALGHWFDAPANIDQSSTAIASAFEVWGVTEGAQRPPARRGRRGSMSWSSGDGRASARLEPACAEDARFFSRDLFGVDVGRRGVTFAQGG